VQRTTHTASAGFEAACHVDVLPPGHRARAMHGHSYSARVRCELPPGWATFPGAEVGDLAAALRRAVAPLDYSLLNQQLERPTDENLARWVRARLAGEGVPGIVQVGIQSTTDSGADLDSTDQAHLWRRYAFQSAHRLPRVRPGHKCGRLHGHGFEAIVHANVDLGARDLAVDYDHLDEVWAPLHEALDHRCLNELPGLDNPTSEIISSWLWQRLLPVLPELAWVTVYETGSSGANFDGTRYRIWKEFSLDSAVRLKRAPDGDRRARVHGHTWTLRLHLAAPLDEVMGWTMDFGDVKELFAPVFRELDHQPLHEHPQLADGDAATLAAWFLDRARRHLPQLDRVDLFETRGTGAIVCAGDEGPALPI
jgi:6-pyruvoyltetrahydropterin/6-carboxytetrahydropterin synthase